MTAVAPGRIRLPLRVHLTPSGDAEHEAARVRTEVARAVEEACRRISWSGLGIGAGELADAVGAPADDDESLLAVAALVGAREGAALAGIGVARDATSAPARPAASEPFDPLRVRWHPDGCTYRLPWFDGGEIEVPLRDESARPAPSLPAAGAIVTMREALDIAWEWHLHRQRGPALHREKPGYFGRIRGSRGTFTGFVFIASAAVLDGRGRLVHGRLTSYSDSMPWGWMGIQIVSDPSYSMSSIGGDWGAADGDSIPIVLAMQPRPTTAAGEAGEGSATDPGEGAEIGTDAVEGEGPTPIRWPGNTGRPGALVCQPFLIEPSIERIVDRLDLAERTRHLAAQLGIEECGYPGTFAMHLCEALRARARGVAEAVIRSTVRTRVTVRPDGGGNNGFVEVAAGEATELDDLVLLARLGVEVGDFANDVVATYGTPENRALVGAWSDSPPSWAAWALRFYREFEPRMAGAFEAVFGETCRCLLLQQLRSSRDGIEARRGAHFAQTVEDMRMKLEIIGETVVWPTVLLRTIEHAHAVRLMHSSDTVRGVLSISELDTSDPHQTITFPPPIGSIPPRILAEVGGARVLRGDGDWVIEHSGQRYTADALRQMINDRRRLLNMTDPLFLQIEDAASIAMAASSDPAWLERYLRDLLDRMAAANRRMREETESFDDGAAFAIAASQYVRREGGRDARGLRYSLEGIHRLADDRLRSVVGHSGRYADGVNQALGRRERRDMLVTLGATIGIVILGLLCAPLGAIAVAAITGLAGLAFTALDVIDANRREDLYRALEDPELLQRWQDVQLAQLMASIGVAFSVFDVFQVGRAARLVTRGALDATRSVVRVGLRETVRLASAEVRERAIRSMSAELLQTALRQAMQEAATIAVMEQLLPRVIGPVLTPWIREQARMHGTLPRVDAILAAGGAP